MRIFLIIFLNMFLAFTACNKKADVEADASKTEKPLNDIGKDLQKFNEDLKEDLQAKKAEEPVIEKKEKAQATIKIQKKKKKEKRMVIKLKTGTVQIKLRPDLAPKHVERITTLANKGFYNGLKFHRVINGFMAQTGDPLGNGTGGSELPDLQSEFSSAPFNRGVLGMARSASPHSANSQFFIMLAEAPHLNNAYTVFGEVVSGMEHVDQIKLGDGPNGAVSEPDTMISVSVPE